MNRIKKCVLALAALTLMQSCATTDRGLVGAGIGATVGLGAGAITTHSVEGAAIGAATGALVGGAIGLLTRKSTPTEEHQKKETLKGEDLYPFLTKPDVQTIWVPDSIESNRYIEGHRVYIINKGSSWSKDDE